MRSVPSVSLLSCWNRTNNDRSETHKLGRIALVRPPQRNDEFSTSKTFQGRRLFNKVFFTFPESPRVVSRAKHARFNDLSYPSSNIQTSNRYASLQDSTVEVESLEKKNDTPKKRIVRPGEDDYATVLKRRSQSSNGVMQGTRNMISIPDNKEHGNQNFPVEQQTWRKQIHPSRVKMRKQTK